MKFFLCTLVGFILIPSALWACCSVEANMTLSGWSCTPPDSPGGWDACDGWPPVTEPVLYGPWATNETARSPQARAEFLVGCVESQNPHPADFQVAVTSDACQTVSFRDDYGLFEATACLDGTARLFRAAGINFPGAFYATYTYAGTWNVTCTQTAVTLSSFQALRLGMLTLLVWETAAEFDTAGFNIYRSDRQAALGEPINQALIASRGTAQTGARYLFLDFGYGTHWYRLEDVDTQGLATLHAATPVNLLLQQAQHEN